MSCLSTFAMKRWSACASSAISSSRRCALTGERSVMRVMTTSRAAQRTTTVQRACFHSQHNKCFQTNSQHRLNSRISHVQVAHRSFASSSLPEHTVLPMPALSPTMEKGNIASWKVNIGDKVKPGQVMAEVETDKATVAFESVEEGYVAAILKPAGSSDVPVNTPVAILVEDAELVAAFKDYKGEGGAPAAPAAATPAEPKKEEKSPQQQPAAVASQQQQQPQQTPAIPSGRVIASPNARRIAELEGVDLSRIQGTGPNSRILTADVKEQKATASAPQPTSVAAAAPSIAVSSSGDYTDIPLSNVRKVIAQRLTQSYQQIPHYYVSVEVPMDKVLKLRSELNNTMAADAKLSVNDFVIKACALALRKVPAVNSTWTDKAIRQFNYVDISVAVATEGGLITPIVKDADIRGLSSISGEVKVLAGKARQNKLQPHEYQGGTFTISNLGMFGVKHFTAIINPPQSAILAVGGTDTKVIATKNADGTQSFSTQQVMTVTLSSDHRVIDGAMAAQWLQAFKGFLENPVTMLL